MRDADFQWLVEQGPELTREYAGNWIAVRDDKVIGVGETATTAAQQAKKHAAAGEFILEAIDAEADVIYAFA